MHAHSEFDVIVTVSVIPGTTTTAAIIVVIIMIIATCSIIKNIIKSNSLYYYRSYDCLFNTSIVINQNSQSS